MACCRLDRWCVFVLFVTVVESDCTLVNVTDVSICYPYVSPYADSVYVNFNPATQVPFATILQQYCDMFLEFNYRKFYWAIACGLAYQSA
jgi:hypothetical protein